MVSHSRSQNEDQQWGGVVLGALLGSVAGPAGAVFGAFLGLLLTSRE